MGAENEKDYEADKSVEIIEDDLDNVAGGGWGDAERAAKEAYRRAHPEPGKSYGPRR